MLLRQFSVNHCNCGHARNSLGKGKITFLHINDMNHICHTISFTTYTMSLPENDVQCFILCMVAWKLDVAHLNLWLILLLSEVKQIITELSLWVNYSCKNGLDLDFQVFTGHVRSLKNRSVLVRVNPLII